MMVLSNDLKYAFRQLQKSPGFSLTALVVLALAIGGTSSMFTLVNALLLRPLPVKNPEQLVRLYAKENRPDGGYRSFSYPNMVDIRQANDTFSNITGFSITLLGIIEGDLTRRTMAAMVPANYFDTFEVSMAAGRAFTAEEERPGSQIPAVVLSYKFWERRGKYPRILGKTIRLNTRDFEVIGIAPKYFTGPSHLISPEFWLPLGMYEAMRSDLINEKDDRLDARDQHHLFVFGRLKPGVTLDAVQSRMAAMGNQLAQAYPVINKDLTIEVGRLARISLSSNPVKESFITVLSVLLMTLSGAVLLIASLNIANMLLARGTARRKEIAVRLALGGSRWHIIRQLLIEGGLLSFLGGAMGLLLAYLVTRAIIASFSPKVPFFQVAFDIRPDLRVLLGTLAFCGLSVLCFGLGPAWKLSRTDIVSHLKEQLTTGRRARFHLGILSPRNLLVVGQIAMSLVLLTATGLFLRGALNAANANPGFPLKNSILAEVDMSLTNFDEVRIRRMYPAIAEKLRTLPGVESVSYASIVPFGLVMEGRKVCLPGNSQDNFGPDNEAASTYANLNVVADDYFKTLRMPLLRGREFNKIEVESTNASPVAIIDEPLARQLWPDQDPIGQLIQFADYHEAGDIMEIVGIVPGIRDRVSDHQPTTHIYIPFGQKYRSSVTFHLKTSPLSHQAEAALFKTVRQTIRNIDSSIPVLSVLTFEGFHDNGFMVWIVKMGGRLFAIFGGLALFLAVIGLYGVRAYDVARHTRQIGIRIALGATGKNVLLMSLREGIIISCLGLGLGLPLALGAGFMLRSMLFGVSGTDLATFVIAPLFLTVTTMAACWIPARRAAKVDPMEALRYE
jgi:predicted permease